MLSALAFFCRADPPTIASTAEPTFVGGETPSTMATYSEEQLELYLQHIRYPRTKHPEDRLQLLMGLVRHHQARVPFDSIALHYSPTRLLSLDPADLFDKIVTRSRGGYCMEVNELFATVLRTLGFKLYSAAGRVKHERL